MPCWCLGILSVHSAFSGDKSLGISLGDIKLGGGWIEELASPETHCLSTLPSRSALDMAGFRLPPSQHDHPSNGSTASDIPMKRRYFRTRLY
ncbi:hypothetical protein PS15m_005883 [Mucor circinelloides]